jgi:hypothetical protein
MERTEIAEIWTFRTGPEVDVEALDLTGYKVEATDGEIGKVDNATYETDVSYLIVDTGPWIFGHKILLPAGVVERIDTADERVYVDRTQEEIKSAPEFDPNEHKDAGDYRGRVGEYYGRG